MSNQVSRKIVEFSIDYVDHVCFHLGDLVAALLGVVHSLISAPPPFRCPRKDRPFIDGFKGRLERLRPLRQRYL